MFTTDEDNQSNKRELGQYFTKNDIWLKDNIRKFILDSGCSVAYDPFAGSGDLLRVATSLGFKKVIGMDIDEKLGWKKNDSLLQIPHIDNAIIITNPPYLSNYSAKRRKILDKVKRYFGNTVYNDLYLIALENMLKVQDFVIAIVPETFINSTFPKSKVYSINILEENPFSETENPICVVCFDGKIKSKNYIKVYKNSHFVTTLGELEGKRLKSRSIHHIKFNSISGNLALRAVDTTNPHKRIAFMKKEKLDYNLAGIKQSSRLITLIDVHLVESKLDRLIEACNNTLEKYRKDTDDILLSPFKGNMKNGIRRRRLDYRTARAIIEKAFEVVKGVEHAKEYRTVQLFNK